MNYNHFSSLGYVSRHSSPFSHPYRVVNPVASKKERFSGLRSISDKNVIDYTGVSDTTSFRNFLLQHPIAFVWFHATWCGHCISMKNDFSEAASKLSGKVSFIKVDADQHTQLCRDYNVSGFPTLKLFVDGQVAADYEGKRSASNFINWLQDKI